MTLITEKYDQDTNLRLRENNIHQGYMGTVPSKSATETTCDLNSVYQRKEGTGVMG